MNGTQNLQPSEPDWDEMDDPQARQRLRDYFQKVAEMAPGKRAFMRQRAVADQLRQAAPQAAMRRSPGLIHAQHPLEAVSDVLRAGTGAYMGRKADEAEDKYTAGRRRLLEELMAPRRQGGYGGAGGTGYGSDY